MNSTEHIDKAIQDFKNKIILLRHEIATFNTVHEDKSPLTKQYEFKISSHYLSRLNLMQEISAFETIEKSQHHLNNSVHQKIDDLIYFARTSLRQKYERI